MAGVDHPDRSAAGAHHQALGACALLVEPHTSEQGAVGEAGGGDEAVVALGQVVLPEDLIEIEAGLDHGGAFLLALRAETSLDLTAHGL